MILDFVASRLGLYISGEGLKPITWKKILLRSDYRCGLIDTARNQLHMTLWMVYSCTLLLS
jgi:hypothetical protein